MDAIVVPIFMVMAPIVIILANHIQRLQFKRAQMMEELSRREIETRLHEISLVTRVDNDEPVDARKNMKKEVSFVNPDISILDSVIPAFKFCGEHDSDTVYERGDLVISDGKIFVCTGTGFGKFKEISSGVEPNDSIDNLVGTTCKGCGAPVLVGHRCEYCGRYA